MLDYRTIEEMTRKSARRAKAAKNLPHIVGLTELKAWKAAVGAGKLPSLPFPFIGTWRPRGFRLMQVLFVDSSGWGRSDEPSLTVPCFVNDYLKLGAAYAIVEAGEFQVYIGEFEVSPHGYKRIAEGEAA